MKTATTVCGTCGAMIAGNATDEVCPACLLESLGLLDDEAVAPTRRDLSAVTPKTFGAVVLDRQIGQGSSWHEVQGDGDLRDARDERLQV